jgi:hypothetical protein
MPAYEVGQRVRVRREHTGCTWCIAVRGRAGSVRRVTQLDVEPMYDVALDEAPGLRPVVAPLKEECLETAP